MKNQFTFLLLLISLFGYSQVDTTRELPKAHVRGYAWKMVGADSGFYLPNDTFKLKSTWRGVAFKGGTPYYWNGTKWNTFGSMSNAKSGLSLSSDTVLLGGSNLDRYSPIYLNGYPLTFRHDGVNNAAQIDSNSIRLVNNNASTSITDSLVTPQILFSVNSWKPNPPTSSRNVVFTMDAVGTSHTSSYFRLKAKTTTSPTFIDIFSINSNGQILQDLNVEGVTVGVPPGSAGSSNFRIGGINLTAGVSGTSNYAFGGGALASITTAERNIAMGSKALETNIIGNENVAIGHEALVSNDTNYNTAVGAFALRATTKGQANAAFGKNTLLANTTGFKNTAIGAAAMETNTVGTHNTYLGMDAGLNEIDGHFNAAVGWLAGANNISGDENSLLGASTGRSVTYGNQNIFIGYNAGYNGQQNDTVHNSIAIGYNSYSTADSQIVIGAESHDDLRLFGVVPGSTTDSVLVYDPATKQTRYRDASAFSGGSVTTLYTGNGALSSNRTVDISGRTLLFGGVTAFLNLDDPGGDLGIVVSDDFSVQANDVLWLTDPGTIYDTTNTKILVRHQSSGRMYETHWPVSGSSGWSLTGNSGTSAGTNYVGTSDNVDFDFRTNATQAMRLNTAQELMIGTTTDAGAYKLQLNGNFIANLQHASNRIYIGSVPGSEQYPGIWFLNGTPSLSNYAFLGDISGGGNYLNGSSATGLRVANSDVIRAMGTGVGVFNTSPSAALHIIRTTEQLRVGYDVSNYYSSTVSSTGGVTFNAVGSGSAFSFSDDISATNLSSNTVTPTLTGVSNVASTSTSSLKYVRYGNVVSYTGFFIVNTTASGSTQFGFSLPIASAFTSSGDLFGSCAVQSATGGDDKAGYALADATNDRGNVTFTAAAGEAVTVIVSGHYTIK